ncbi:unnamed protein product [Rotaria magnacalcarata]|uniref:Uncharacterized protein n=1 Tax=Rotaria magnacalcarata TaxID=392030 RepID=A0A819KTA6_9BILA|nr:unnamed protein product [Rotaria magnacalcarata]CAF4041949.1 unnamed protein product [Rotaria magnacalcarata]CAF4102225.1 unnamed protein product [Rotaria magnacalcarata]CAF4140419.1 unnamed protein product [Rotaria magnacalcarata]CAF4256383.1 unnamed protein product [Rotaria magnacalcarata]
MESVQPGLSVDRIEGHCEMDINDLKCDICTKILWQPVACRTCEVAFCSGCINQWLAQNSGVCRKNCREFVQRSCPRFIVQQLSRLQFKCQNSLQGCDQILAYESIEAHELECGYKQTQCQGCHEAVLRKNHIDHENTCPQIELKCSECNITYKRGDGPAVHTEIICLKEQLRQLRLEFQAHTKHEGQQIDELTEKIQPLPETLQQLQQASESNKQQVSDDIKSFQQALAADKEQTSKEIQQIQQKFQLTGEKSSTEMEDLKKQLERK